MECTSTGVSSRQWLADKNISGEYFQAFYEYLLNILYCTISHRSFPDTPLN